MNRRLFPELDRVVSNSTTEKFAKFWQIDRGRIIAVKFETARIRLSVLSDVFAVVAFVFVGSFSNDDGDGNRPLQSSKNPHFQNEAWCTTFLVKMSFICMRMKNDFHIKGWAPILVLKQKPGGTRKWRIRKWKNNRFNEQNSNFARASRFFAHSLPSLHDYDVKMLNFTFYGGRRQATMIFYFLVDGAKAIYWKLLRCFSLWTAVQTSGNFGFSLKSYPMLVPSP